jgi:2-succinyl-6-hydroxy-2,4-cyclohexadiene-1-carboxylate synthase
VTVLLHGFWGQPADWNAVLAELPLTEPLWIPDLYEAGPLSPDHDLPEWCAAFLDEIERREAGRPVRLVGYSMGGRLALHACLRRPEAFSRVLLLSARPYLNEDVAERERWETRWAEKFLTAPWSALEEAWQDQAVLRASAGSPRRRDEALRGALARCLRQRSVRRHGIALAALKALPETVDWAFGALDQKYLQVAKDLQELPVRGQITVIPNAGHRLITDASAFIARWIAQGENRDGRLY